MNKAAGYFGHKTAEDISKIAGEIAASKRPAKLTEAIFEAIENFKKPKSPTP